MRKLSNKLAIRAAMRRMSDVRRVYALAMSIVEAALEWHAAGRDERIDRDDRYAREINAEAKLEKAVREFKETME